MKILEYSSIPKVFRGNLNQLKYLRSQIPSTAAITESGKVLVLKIESYTDAGSYICSLKVISLNIQRVSLL